MKFVLRLGELHAAFAMLKVIGKYIESSGLDSPFFESRTYGEATHKQILQGKHMKRGLEADIYIHLAMTWVSFKEWLTSNRKCKDVMNDITSMTKELKQLKYIDQRTYKAFTIELWKSLN